MNIINYTANKNIKEIQTGGKFEVNTGIFVERRYFYTANEKKVHYQDTLVFTCIAGEYGDNAKVEVN